MGPGPADAPGDLLKMYIQGPTPDLLDQHSGGGPGRLCLNKTLKGIPRILEHRDETMEGKRLPALRVPPPFLSSYSHTDESISFYTPPSTSPFPRINVNIS